MSLLEIKNLSVYYGKALAIQDVSLSVQEDQPIAVIGPNGAGKSSLLRAIAGLAPYQGSIRFQGKDIRGLRPFEIARKKIILCPEGRGLFPELSVRQNLNMGAYTRKDREQVKRDLDMAFDLFPELKNRESSLARQLSGGEQQMLAIARAMLARPLMLMLDEPSMGLAVLVKDRIAQSIKDISNEGVSIFLVEQDVHLAMDIAYKLYLFENGRISLEGTVQELENNPYIKESYLGIS